MSDLLERVDSGLDALRQGLNSDGADLKVEALSDSNVRVSLVVTPETCEECIVSTDLMETMIKSLVGQVAPEANVDFVDPRAADN